MLLFQSPSWKSKAERAKASFDVCQVTFGENELDSMPRDFEREKAKSKKTEVTELYFFCYNEQNQLACVPREQRSCS